MSIAHFTNNTKSTSKHFTKKGNQQNEDSSFEWNVTFISEQPSQCKEVVIDILPVLEEELKVSSDVVIDILPKPIETDINEITIFGVNDGHGGLNGMLASQTASKNSIIYLTEKIKPTETYNFEQIHKICSDLFEDNNNMIRQALKNLSGTYTIDHTNVVRNLKNEYINGGTTSTVCIIIKYKNGRKSVTTLNCGDSTCMIVSSKYAERYKITSTEHSPDNLDEYLRIKEMNLPNPFQMVYSCYNKQFMPIFNPDTHELNRHYVDDPVSFKIIPSTIRGDLSSYAMGKGKDHAQLAMTRALGDLYCCQYGLISTPSSSTEYFSKEETGEVIVASDGLWDAWKYNELVNLLLEQNDMRSFLIVDQIEKCFGKHGCDDTTYITHKF